MKKIITFLLCSFCLIGCTNVYVYDFMVDSEKLTLTLHENLMVKEKDNGFSIEKDNIQIQGMFIETSTFDQYYASVLNEDSVTILEQSKTKLIWKVKGNSGWEWNCLVRIDAHSSVLMGCLEDAQAIYQSLEFEK